MEIDKAGWPIIQSGDYPLTIYNALRDNDQAWRENRHPLEVEHWTAKTKLDASETVSDGFTIVLDKVHQPEGETKIYVRPEQLEFSLVAHGCRLLDDEAPEAETEVENIDQLLNEVDRVTGRNQEQFQQLANLLGNLYLQKI